MAPKMSIDSDSEYVGSPESYASEASMVSIKKAPMKRGRESSGNSSSKGTGRPNHSQYTSTEPESEKVRAPPSRKQRALERKATMPKVQFSWDEPKVQHSEPTLIKTWGAALREKRLPSAVTDGNKIVNGDNNVLLVVELPRGKDNDMLLHDNYGGEVFNEKALDETTILLNTLQKYHTLCNKLNVFFHFSKGAPAKPWMDHEVIRTLNMLLQAADTYEFAFKIGAPDHPLAYDSVTRRRERLNMRSLEIVFENMAIETGLDHVISAEEFKGVPLIVPDVPDVPGSVRSNSTDPSST